MKYAKIIDGQVEEYPYTLAKLKADNPGTSFPREMADDLLAEFNVFKVQPSSRPEVTLTQKPVEDTPVFSEGQWIQVWTMVDLSPEEAARRQQKEEALAIKADTFVQNFIAMSPAQITAYVEGNTNNITEVRALLNRMALMLLILARREFR